MKVINTTDQEIRVNILGKEYVLEAEGELTGVPQKDAEYWVTKLHQFLIVEAEDEDKKKVEQSPQRVKDIEKAEEAGDLKPEEAKAAKEKAEKEAAAAAAKEEEKKDDKEEDKKEEKKEDKKEEVKDNK